MSVSIESSSFREVPEWRTYCPSLYSATLEQKRFYNYWLREFEKGNIIDIRGNLSYVFVYLYSIIEQFKIDKSIGGLLQRFDKVKAAYGDSDSIRANITGWKAEAYLYLENYDEAWKVIRHERRSNVDEIIFLRSKCRDTSIDGEDFVWILGSDGGLTEFGKKHQKEIANLANLFLKDFYREHGRNLVEHFCREFDFAKLAEDDYSRLRQYYPNEKEFVFWKEKHERENWEKRHYTNRRNILWGAELQGAELQYDAIPTIVSVAFRNEAKRILRECENTFREEKDLPRIGEGWISETELFYELCKEFPEEKIIHHGRPEWLARQHIDIYFPLRNIGCEYQGAQHQNPVEYFGGQRAFEEGQKLDKRKRELCEVNGCRLIYISEGYDFEKLKGQIRKMISDSRL